MATVTQVSQPGMCPTIAEAAKMLAGWLVLGLISWAPIIAAFLIIRGLCK